jgi:hypothetical protein
MKRTPSRVSFGITSSRLSRGLGLGAHGSRCRLGLVAMGVLVSAASPRLARAQSADASTQADAAFKEAQRLHAAGDDASACPKYAESKRLAPEVGVTLHLADCYAKTGKSASAWNEFQEAE